MKNLNTLVLCLFLTTISLNSIGQGIRFSSSYGYAVIKTENFKDIALLRETVLGYEFAIGNDWTLPVGIGKTNIQYSYSDFSIQNIYSNNVYLSFPIGVKKHFPLSVKQTHWVYTDFGIVGLYNLQTKKEFTNQSSVDKSTGINACGYFNVGYKTIVGKGFYFDIKFGGLSNLYQKYKKKSDEIKIKQSTNLGFSIYKEF